MIDVSIIIVNYNTKELTASCINSILNFTTGINYEIILVDNNSNDGSQLLFRHNTKIRFIESDKNLGFGKANNLGYKYAKGKYIFLLNSDTLLQNNAIKIFFDHAESCHSSIGCWGTILLNQKNEKIHSFGKFPSIHRDLIYELLLPIYKLLKYNPESKIEYQIRKPTYVDYITGADLFIRKEIIDEIGFFDPNFFLYYEETDIQYNYKKNGYLSQIIIEPQIVHLEGGSQALKKSNLNRSLIILDSKLYFFSKWNSHIIFIIYCIVLFIIRIPFLLFSKYSLKEKHKYIKTLFKWI